LTVAARRGHRAPGFAARAFKRVQRVGLGGLFAKCAQGSVVHVPALPSFSPKRTVRVRAPLVVVQRAFTATRRFA